MIKSFFIKKSKPNFNKKASLEFEELVKIILASSFLLVLIAIVGFLMKDKISEQFDKIFDIFNFF